MSKKRKARQAPPPGQFRRTAAVALLGGIFLCALAVLAVTGKAPAPTRADTAVPAVTPTPLPDIGPNPPEVAVRLVGLAYDGTPEPLPTPTPTPTPTPGPARPASAEGLRLWSHGDSTSYWVTVALYELWRNEGGIPVAAADYKISSGLANATFFDWPNFASAEMARYDPDVAVVMLGGNDILQMGNRSTYAGRVGRMMDNMYREGRLVVWLGQPNFGPGHEDMAARVHDLNAVFQEEAEKRSWVLYVDTFWLTSWSDGSFAWEQPNVYGTYVKIRHEDGIHFSSAGGRHIAVAVMAAILGR